MPGSFKSEVGHEDLPSIGTLHSRAFHPANEWHRKVFPTSVAPWWEERYALDINDPNCYLLKVSSPKSSTTVLGLISLYKYHAHEKGAGRWAFFPPPPQVDREMYDAMINAMAEYREKFMLGQPHFCIYHFGVDAKHQGQGLGKRLMARACDIADQEKLNIFVEANEFAESFYHKFGFETVHKVEMPGGLTECFLIRRFG
ncbi:MAG: hypothetical protein Q9210_003636 [Variospora velana]